MKEFIKQSLFTKITNISRNKTLLIENTVNGKTIVNVDIQPEYKKWVSFNLDNWVSFINSSINSNRVIFLYNGEDTLGMISENDYKSWLYELGIDENVIEEAIFYDKGYAFFRYCMDEHLDDESIVNLIKFMIKNNINDSRELDERMWKKFVKEYSDDHIKSVMEVSSDAINIPDLMSFITNYNNIVLTGGGVNECLKEVELALMALDKPYSILSQFTY